LASGDSFVFVSYTAADEAWATWVASVLEEAGLTARIQVWDSTPGTNFVQWMNTQLAEARWTVALYSKAYFASQWCTTEWTTSLARQTLLPIRLERVEPPETLRVITWVDLFDLDEERAKGKVLHAVGAQEIPRLGVYPGISINVPLPSSGSGGKHDFVPMRCVVCLQTFQNGNCEPILSRGSEKGAFVTMHCYQCSSTTLVSARRFKRELRQLSTMKKLAESERKNGS
jgi:hypothetical protein